MVATKINGESVNKTDSFSMQSANGLFYWEASEQKQRADEMLDSLPLATLHPIEISYAKNPEGFQAVVNEQTNTIVGTVSKKYVLVQHKEAFQPIVEGLNSLGSSYKMGVRKTKTKAWISVLTTETADGVVVGFEALNSIDGSTAIRYGFSTFRTTGVVELVGYRQVCSNGMKIRVPLDEAEFVMPELSVRVKALLDKSIRIVHVGKAQEKVELVRYVVEAMELLKEPIARMIDKAGRTKVTNAVADLMIEKYLGKRLNKKVRYQFRKEEQTLWGLYNAMTFVASHDREIAMTSSNSLIDNSAEMLTNELTGGKDAVLTVGVKHG